MACLPLCVPPALAYHPYRCVPREMASSLPPRPECTSMPPADSGDYTAFRARLDDVLRRQDPAALRAFLVAEGQWRPDATTDTEAAMWMMIATSPALRSMHDDARRWLLAHGHEAEAAAIFPAHHPAASRGKPVSGGKRASPSPARSPRGRSQPLAHPAEKPRGKKPAPRSRPDA